MKTYVCAFLACLLYALCERFRCLCLFAMCILRKILLLIVAIFGRRLKSNYLLQLSVDELAAYVEHNLNIPKPMSDAAQSMYS